MESDVDLLDNNAEGDVSDKLVLPTAVEFLDHFDVSLDVVVGCARKTEVTRWQHLFDYVGNPKKLFEVSKVLYISTYY